MKIHILTLTLMTALGAQAATVDFTAAEGYVDGDINLHTDWVAEAANVVSTNADGYNGAKGTVALDIDSTLRDAVYNLPSPVSATDDTMTIRSVFRFSSSGDYVETRWDIHTHAYFDSWATDANWIRANLCRKPRVNNTFDVRIRGDAHDYSATFLGTRLGLASDGTGTTDWLQLTTTLRRPVAGTEWEVDVVLENLATADVILNETVDTVARVGDFFTALTYYPGFNSGNTDAQLLVSNRQIDFFEFTSSGGPPVNQPPAFDNDPFSKPNADIGVAYNDSIAGDASDPESDPMTFSKIDGPVWLNVVSNGILSGTPHSTNVGVNAFTVQVSATGGVDTATLNITVNAPPPDPTGWEQFVTDFSLTGNEFDDADSDTVYDVYEWAHGGDPTNPADKGILPYVDFGSNDVVNFVSLETTHTNPGITYTAEWTEHLTDTVWGTVFDAVATNPAAIPDYNEVIRSISGAGESELFFRNRLFDPPPTPTGRPNIVFIQCDDLGYCDVGFNAAIYGEKPTSFVSPQTPNIDSLADDGMIFTEAYCAHPFCGPSRMGLMTGRYPHHFGGSKNLPYETLNLPNPAIPGFEPANGLGLPTNETTMATVLQDAGYYTGAIGKWHMGVASQTHPNNRGFDYWYGFLGGGHNYYSEGWIPKASAINDYQFWLTRNDTEHDSPDGLYLTDMLSDDAVSFITNAPAGQPLFLYLNYNAPHTPHQAKPADLIALFGRSGNNDDYESQELITAMMFAVDRGVGNIVDALTAEGILNDTLIVFLSDNGGKLGDDADNGPLSGGKGNTLEGGIRTPMFMYYPAVLSAGSTYDHPVAMYDFYPTFAGLAEAIVPEEKVLSGADIWDDILADQNANTNTMVWVRHNNATGGHQIGLRKGNFKAHRLNFGAWRLYDLSTDIGESMDIKNTGSNYTTLTNMINDGLMWSADGVDPLWHDTQAGYDYWLSTGAPNYTNSFSP